MAELVGEDGAQLRHAERLQQRQPEPMTRRLPKPMKPPRAATHAFTSATR